jgi:phosphotransferase system HPr-like phosphotransfer protein
MSKPSLDEILSEKGFQALASRRGGRFGRLTHTLLVREKWTRRHFYQLIAEADVFESFLDDHGANHNQRYRPLRELVASVRGLSRAGFAVRHLESRINTYGVSFACEEDEEERFAEAVVEARSFLEQSLRGLLAAVLEESLAGEIELPSELFADDEYITDHSRKRLPRNLDGEIQEDEEHYIATVATRYLEVSELFSSFQLGGSEAPVGGERLLSEFCTEERARVYEASVHNLQSTYDTYIKNTTLEDSDERLPRLRGHVSVTFHLLEGFTELIHFVERHERARSLEANSRIPGAVDRARVVQVAVENLLTWAARMIILGRPYAEALVPTYTNQSELLVEVPPELTLHARPVALIVKIVTHHGTATTCEVGGTECNAGSILEMMVTVGSHPELNRYCFSGDARTLEDIERLFAAGLGEPGMGSLPPELGYL